MGACKTTITVNHDISPAVDKIEELLIEARDLLDGINNIKVTLSAYSDEGMYSHVLDIIFDKSISKHDLKLLKNILTMKDDNVSELKGEH